MLKFRKYNFVLRFQKSIIGQHRSQTNVAASTTVEPTDWERAKPYEQLPKENYFSLIRKSIFNGKYKNMDPMEVMQALQEAHGNVFIMPPMFGRPSIVVTYNPTDFETVFRHEGVWPERPGSEAMKYHREKHRAKFFQGIEGLIATQGKSWGDFRSAVNPVLMQPKNVRLYYQKMSQVNKEFIERIKEIRDARTLEVPDNFEEEINRWTLESVSVVALDKQLGLLRHNRDDPRIKQLFSSLTDFFSLQADLEFKPSIWRYVRTPKFNKLMKAFDSIHEITLHYVNEAIDRLDQERVKGIVRPENQQSVLEKLLKLDKKIAIVMAMDMLMAGVDTTSSTFAGIMLCLAQNPAKQDKLRKEIMNILPHKDSEFTEESMKNVPYLRACLKESLRIYPLVIGNARVTQRDCVLSGYRVPKGTQISMMPLGLLTSEQYFPQAETFLPERWLRPENSEEVNMLKLSNPFVFLPFGFGPRMCIGKRIVDMELELGVARIIRNFKVEFNYPTEKAFKNLLINVPNIPLKFKFTDI